MQSHGGRSGSAAALVVLLIVPVAWPAVRQQQQEGVTPEMIAAGEKLYAGEGKCLPCHGPQGKGVPGMTASMADGEWAYSGEGTLEELARVIKDGLTPEQTGGMPMPASPQLTDEQVKGLAAYVWNLNRKEK